jgi:FkbM family methyltransferase
MTQNDKTSHLRTGVKSLLVRFGLYQRLKASWIYDFYWNLTDAQIIKDRQLEINFYRELLAGFRKGDVIFDVGANQGYKTDIFLRLGAMVVAVEPDETSQETLQQKFLKFRFAKKPLTIVGKAVSDRSRTETMWIDTPGGAKNTLSQKWAESLQGQDERFGVRLSFGNQKEVETVSIKQLVAAHGSPYFIKIDVEGHELSVLKGLATPVPYLSFEVNLPEFREEGLGCIEVLKNLAPDGRFNYTPDCRQSLVMGHWVESDEIASVLRSCNDESIEIFWRTSPRN